jgi:hypothetical protein
MKNLFLVLCSFILSLSPLAAQNTSNVSTIKDSLTWYIYVGGKPCMDCLKAREIAARNWGIKSNVFFGNCVGTHDYKAKEFEIKNKDVYEYLTQKYGVNWKEELKKETEKHLAIIRAERKKN